MGKSPIFRALVTCISVALLSAGCTTRTEPVVKETPTPTSIADYKTGSTELGTYPAATDAELKEFLAAWDASCNLAKNKGFSMTLSSEPGQSFVFPDGARTVGQYDFVQIPGPNSVGSFFQDQMCMVPEEIKQSKINPNLDHYLEVVSDGVYAWYQHQGSPNLDQIIYEIKDGKVFSKYTPALGTIFYSYGVTASQQAAFDSYIATVIDTRSYISEHIIGMDLDEATALALEHGYDVEVSDTAPDSQNVISVWVDDNNVVTGMQVAG